MRASNYLCDRSSPSIDEAPVAAPTTQRTSDPNQRFACVRCRFTYQPMASCRPSPMRCVGA